jgi:7,8-dihydropterin-6-yl-methyl-4-(beta-D-ribofuranosyl)aminobenzene 5'-phosphate synthase
MHLLHAGEERIARTGVAFEAYGVERMGPCHCTGVGAVSAFRSRFPLQFEEIYAGKTVRFE